MSDILKFNTEDVHGTRVEQIKLFTLVKEHDTILQEVLPEFDFSDPPVDPIEFASTLVETCKHNKGLGLSANQCGFKHRVFVMGANDDFVAFFNPKVILQTEKTAHMEEGCLSFPYLFLHITRPESIQVEYQDFNGETKNATFSGLSARCFLHELDHMNGVTFNKKAKPLALKSGSAKRAKLFDRFTKAKKKIDMLSKRV